MKSCLAAMLILALANHPGSLQAQQSLKAQQLPQVRRPQQAPQTRQLLQTQPILPTRPNAAILPKSPVSVTTFRLKERTISPMPLAERISRGLVPARGICSISPGRGRNDLMMSGNGKMRVDVYGDPLAEQIVFRRERLQVPWKTPFEAPKIAYILPEVRKLIMEGQYKAALDLSLKASSDVGFPPGTLNHPLIPAFTMKLDMPGTDQITRYLRTTDFESGEIKIRWTDPNGESERKIFVSRPDNLVVQLLKPPQGKLLHTRISLRTISSMLMEAANLDKDSLLHVETTVDERHFIVRGRFTPNTGTTGYAGVIRIILNGGSATVQNGALVIENANSVELLTRIEWYGEFKEEKVRELVSALDTIEPDYQALLVRNRVLQSEMIDRASLYFNSDKKERAMSGEELLSSQRIHIGYNPAMLEKLFDMGRYWLMLDCGDFPPIYGHLNINVNLQVAGGVIANLPECMHSFYHWIEGALPDAKMNAKNIFGTRGALFSVHPDQQTGVLYHFDWVWPHHYWISAGGWAYSPFWDHYLASGDKEFLRDEVMPGLRELGLFYEDYLSSTDPSGNYIFVPSYSPENWPSNTDEGHSHQDANGNWVNAPVVINATMDIMVCREVLTHLIEGAETLGTDAESIPTWKAMLAKMPPYLLDIDGALKEWTWPTLEEHQDHRHASHMYGVWPADEIDPDRTPELAKAAWLANRKRAQGNASGHGISHRMLAAARLKDNYLVNTELKQLLEWGYIGPTLNSSHNPYTGFMPDQQGSILTLLMEMLVYSREGVLEPLPALPATLDKGSIKGILTRSFAKVDEMSWNMKDRIVDLTITSLKEQDLNLVVRYGIGSITAPAGVLKTRPDPDARHCVLHLPANQRVTIHLKLGLHKPSDWVLDGAQ